jgi:hypothetical protein
MRSNWHWWKWGLASGGVLAAISLFGALFLALTGKPDQWITVGLACAIIVVVILQLVRRNPPNA